MKTARRRFPLTLPFLAILLAVLLAGCDDDGGFLDPSEHEGDFVGPLSRESCLAGGKSYSGTIPGGTWRRSASPHLLLDSVSVAGTLVIEPGTLVCGKPGSSLTATKLEVQGNAELPILFTANDAGGWRGVSGGSGHLRHVRIEDADVAVRGEVALQDVHIAGTRFGAVRGPREFRNVIVEDACPSGGCTAISVQPYGHTLLENVTIRRSGGNGIISYRLCSITVDGGLIENIAGVGLQIPYSVGTGCLLQVVRPITITGGGSVPARVHGHAAAALMTSAATMTGNARDTLVVTGFGGSWSGDYVITKDLPWRIDSQCGVTVPRDEVPGSFTVQAGASLTIQGGCIWHIRLNIEGTEAEPATVRGRTRIHSRASVLPIRVRHAILEDVRIRAASAPIIFENVRMVESSLELFAPGSSIDGLHSIGSGAMAVWMDVDTVEPAAVTLGAGTSMQRAHVESARRDGVEVMGAGVTISDCSVTASVRHGIRVEAGDAVVSGCNLFGNGGFGLSSISTQLLDARHNWWGDVAGPFGPSGNGYEGSVDAIPFLTAPITW